MRQPRHTRTGSIEIDVEADVAFAVLADTASVPRWAPAFADAIAPIGGDEHEATKDGRTFGLRFVTRADSRTIDFLRPIFPGRDSGASIRVLPGPQRGCVVVLTLPVPPGADGDSVAATLAVELEAIAGVVEGDARA